MFVYFFHLQFFRIIIFNLSLTEIFLFLKLRIILLFLLTFLFLVLLYLLSFLTQFLSQCFMPFIILFIIFLTFRTLLLFFSHFLQFKQQQNINNKHFYKQYKKIKKKNLHLEISIINFQLKSFKIQQLIEQILLKTMLIQSIERFFNKNDLVIVQLQQLLYWPAKIIRKLAKSHYKVELIDKKLSQKIHLSKIVEFNGQQKLKVLQIYDKNNFYKDDLIKALQLCEKELNYRQIKLRRKNEIEEDIKMQKFQIKQSKRNGVKRKYNKKIVPKYNNNNDSIFDQEDQKDNQIPFQPQKDNQIQYKPQTQQKLHQQDMHDNRTLTLQDDQFILQKQRQIQLFIKDQDEKNDINQKIQKEQQFIKESPTIDQQNLSRINYLQKMRKIIKQDVKIDTILSQQRQQFMAGIKIYRNMQFNSSVFREMFTFIRSFEEQLRQSRKFCLKEYIKVKQIFETAILLRDKCHFNTQISNLMNQYSHKKWIQV